MDQADAKTNERAKLAYVATRLTRTSTAFRQAMAVRAADGSMPMVVVLLTDPVRDLFDAISRNHRDGANVVVGSPNGSIVVLSVRHDESEATPFGEIETDCPVNVDSEVGMLLAYAVVHQGKPVRCLPVTGGYEVEASTPVAVSS